MTGGTWPTGSGPDRLGRPELAPLVDELARRLGDGDVPAVLTLRQLPSGARHALADLFGLDRTPSAVARVPVSRLTGALGLASADELRACVETLRGPLPDRRAARAAGRAARGDLWAWLTEEAAAVALGGSQEWVHPWVERLRAKGARGGIDAHRRRLEDVLRVLRALPADGVPLAGFADDLLEDPHALDRGRSRAAIVLDAIALATGERPVAAGAAEATRRLWEAVGVAPDPLSSSVLVLGLAAPAPAPLGSWLAAATAAGEPVVLTLAQLRRWPLPPLARDAVVHIFENPSLVAEAARGGWFGPPLVCSSGRPTVAVVTLLRQLSAGGCALRQHADFDPAGLAITGWLAQHAGTTPWRMSAFDYLTAVAARRRTTSMIPAVPDTPWDPDLSDAMRKTSCVVYEEELRSDLLAGMR